MPTRRPLPDHLAHGPFLFDEARRAGLSRRRLQGSDIAHPHHGVYDESVAADLVRRCEQLAPLLGPEVWFSHLTAARLWGMPLPTRWTQSEALHVLTRADGPPMRRVGVIGWETATGDVPTRMQGLLPLIAPADTWCQLAIPGALNAETAAAPRVRAHHDWLIAAADYLLSGPRVAGCRQPLCTIADLRSAIGRRRGKRGVRASTLAIDEARSPVDSPWETFTRLELVAHGLPEPRTQVPIHTAAGLRHVDLGYPDARVGIEFQGDEHRTSRRRWLDDLTRVQLFQDAGWVILQVGAADIRPDSSAFISRVRRLIGV